MLGATRAPAFAIAAVVTVVLHSLTPHKEVRFIYLAIATAPILIGLGGARLLALPMLRRRPAATAAAGVLVMLLSVADAVAARTHVLRAEAWRIDRSTTRAFFAAHATANVCGVGVREFWGISLVATPICTAMSRCISRHLNVRSTSRVWTIALPYRWCEEARKDPQRPDVDFAAASGSFNLLIAPGDGALPGFSRIGCYGKDTLGHAEICLFRRPGGCL